MLTLFAIIILMAGFVLFFLDEFSRLYDKIFLIPGMTMLLPLLAASWLVEATGEWSLWFLLRCWTLLNYFVTYLASLFSVSSDANTLVRITILSLLAALPIWAGKFKSKSKSSDYHYLHIQTDYVLFLVWTVVAILTILP
jgi:hypothetical protein